MNKQRYLAELGQLLIFMTSADRDLTLRRFGDLFDEAGPDGGEALTARIGSPTKNAIRLSRSYMPGCLTDELLFQGMDLTAHAPEPMREEPEAPEAAAPEEKPASESAPHTAYDLPEMPDLSEMPELPDLPGAEEPAEEPEADEEGTAEEAEQPGEASEEDEEPAPVNEEDTEESAPEPDDAPAGPKARVPQGFVSVPLHREYELPEEPPEREKPPVERPMPLWAGVPLFILALIVLALPLAALVLILLPVLLAPGAVVLGGAVLAAVGGLWCVSYIADAVLLFGLAFFILGLALLVLWCGFALDVALVKLYIRAVAGLKHLFLGRSVS